jgi:hypothetical protein
MSRCKTAGYGRLHEKGGKLHEMPYHHTLEQYPDAYRGRFRLGAK